MQASKMVRNEREYRPVIHTILCLIFSLAPIQSGRGCGITVINRPGVSLRVSLEALLLVSSLNSFYQPMALISC